MALEDIVQVTITSDGRGVSRKSFGIPLVAGVHTAYGDLARTYKLATAVQDLATDGIPVTHPISKSVAALARNTPKPRDVIVGRLVTAFDQSFDIEVILAEEGTEYAFDVVSPDGTVTPVSYTAIVADTPTLIAAALDAQLTAIADLTSAPTTGVISAAADNPGEMFLVKGLDTRLLKFTETTIDSNLVAELTAITQANGDWYGLILADPQSNARIAAVAGFVETQERIFGATTSDGDVLDPGSTTDIAYLLNASTLFRTYLIYSGDQGQAAAATWMGNRFPIDPGASTWAYKPLSGVVVDTLTANQVSSLTAKKCNWYESIAGAGVTQEGRMAAGEWIDVIRGRDWLTARLRERLFGLLINAPKVPYTQAGIDQVVAQVEAQLREGIGAGYLSPDPITGEEGGPPFFVTAPAIADISKQDKIDRLLPDVNFEAGLAGAIHVIQINGVIKV